jgi:hypothetical protein
VLNLSDQPQQIDFDMPAKALKYVFSTHRNASEALTLQGLKLEPFEVLIGELTSS